MGQLNSLEPRGPAAAEIAFLWWLMFWIAAVVFVVVMGFLVYSLIASRRNRQLSDKASNGLVFYGGALVPAIILLVVFGFALRGMVVLAGPPSPDRAITVQATGHQWWWEVRYPGQGIVTANEVWLPVGERVRLEVTSSDVIHSFWIPNLHGKIDTVPGQTNVFWLEASEEGTYRGVCAEFCGLQHAKMHFIVRAVSREDFDAWAAQQAQPAVEPSNALLREGQQVFLGSACVYCHAIKGTSASGQVGPDLTHLASRATPGAGILPNNKGSLAGWTVNSQAIKPGNRMPPMYIEGQSLQALLAYLGSLQ